MYFRDRLNIYTNVPVVACPGRRPVDLSATKVPPLRYGGRHRRPQSGREARQSLPVDPVRRPAVDIPDGLPDGVLLHRAALRPTQVQDNLGGCR